MGKNGFEYLVQWKDEKTLQCMTSEDATRKIPEHIITFLEGKIEWFTPAHAAQLVDRDPPIQTDNVVGDPIAIHCK